MLQLQAAVEQTCNHNSIRFNSLMVSLTPIYLYDSFRNTMVITRVLVDKLLYGTFSPVDNKFHI